MPRRSLVVVDVADPRHPAFEASYPLADDYIGAELLGETLMLGDRSGVQMADVGDASEFREIGRWEIPGLTSLRTNEQFMFALTRDQRSHTSLHIVDVSVPSTPREVGQTSLLVDWWSPTLQIAGDHVLVYDRGYPRSHGQRIEIVDVSDPVNPVYVASRFDAAKIANDASGHIVNDAEFAGELILRVGGAGRLEILEFTRSAGN